MKYTISLVRIIFSIFILVSAFSFGGSAYAYYDPQQCPARMVSYWKFDEGSGTTAYDSIGGNDGALTNGPVWTAGQVGDALSFDGVDDYVEVSHSTSLDIVDEITMEAWIKPISYGPYSKIFCRVGGNTYSLSVPGGKLWFYMLAGWGGVHTVYNLVSDSIIPTGIWSHVAATYDGSSMKLYINGGEVKERFATGLIATWSGNLLIGNADAAAPNWAFNGLIDEVAIYDKALTPEEIQQHYHNGLIGLGYCVHAPTRARAVDFFDIVYMVTSYGSSQGDPEYIPNCDIDGDGDIDIFDIVIAVGNYGESW